MPFSQGKASWSRGLVIVPVAGLVSVVAVSSTFRRPWPGLKPRGTVSSMEETWPPSTASTSSTWSRAWSSVKPTLTRSPGSEAPMLSRRGCGSGLMDPPSGSPTGIKGSLITGHMLTAWSWTLEVTRNSTTSPAITDTLSSAAEKNDLSASLFPPEASSFLFFSSLLPVHH